MGGLSEGNTGIVDENAVASPMNDRFTKYAKIHRRIVRKRGAFDFFALFLREDAPGLWDLLVAAPWTQPNRPQALRYMWKELNETLTTADKMELSRVVILDRHHPSLREFQRDVPVEDDTDSGAVSWRTI